MKSALVFGTGVSGTAAAMLLLHRGWKVHVSSKNETPDISQLRAAGAEVFVGDPVEAAARFVSSGISDALVVLSPGIPIKAPEVLFCKQAGLRVIGELQLGAEMLRSRLIAITGSKGKSSLVKLISDTLNLNGRTALPCGNYGLALCEVADLSEPPQVAVAECSSFQLETIDAFHPVTAAVLNLSRDHLDRHGTMENYRDVKLDLFRNMGKGDLALLPAASGDDAGLLACFRERYDFSATTFGCGDDAQWRYRRGAVENAQTGFRAELPGSYFDNDVLGPAAALACAVLTNEGLSPAAIEAGFRNFAPLAHRMQLVGELNGVRFVDDSKATSIAALLAGARMTPPPVYLIAGGRLKEKIVTTGKEVVTSGVKKAYLIGECMKEMESAWFPALPVVLCGNLHEALLSALKDVPRGGTILLSPGTASFDQFTDYKQRGEVFTRLVGDLIIKAEKTAEK